MGNSFTLDDLRAEVEREFAPVEITLHDGTVVTLRNLLRLPKKSRDKVVDTLKVLETKEGEEQDVDAMIDAATAVLKMVADNGAALVKELDGDAFGNLSRWTDSMFDFPAVPGARKTLGVYELPDDLRICDLDDPHRLVELGLRPTQVVARNLAVTSQWAHRIWSQWSAAVDGRQWQAVQWWSFHRPIWTVIASWERPTLVALERLDLDHTAVVAAAKSLNRPL